MARKDKLLQKARKFIEKGYLDKAVEEYKSAIDLAPGDVSLRLRLADLLVKTDRTEEAIKEYTDTARANARQGFFLKAIAVYKQILKLDPTNTDINYKLAELYAKQRLVADAMGQYTIILNTFEQKGLGRETGELLKKMVDLDPANVSIRLKLAGFYRKNDFLDDALAIYSEIVKSLVDAGNIKRAEEVCLDLYDTYPSEPRVLGCLVSLYREAGEDDKFVRFAKILSGIYADEGKGSEARPLCEEINRIKPGDEQALKILEEFGPEDHVEETEAGEIEPGGKEQVAGSIEGPDAPGSEVVSEIEEPETPGMPETIEEIEETGTEVEEDVVIDFEGFQQSDEVEAGEVSTGDQVQETGEEPQETDLDEEVEIEIPGVSEGPDEGVSSEGLPEAVDEEESVFDDDIHAEVERLISGVDVDAGPEEEEVLPEEEITAEPEEEASSIEDEVTSGVAPELETPAEETPVEEYAGPETEEEVIAEEAAPVEEEAHAEPETEGSHEEPFPVEEDVTPEEDVAPEPEIKAESEEEGVAPESEEEGVAPESEGDAFVEEEPSAVLDESPETGVTVEPVEEASHEEDLPVTGEFEAPSEVDAVAPEAGVDGTGAGVEGEEASVEDIDARIERFISDDGVGAGPEEEAVAPEPEITAEPDEEAIVEEATPVEEETHAELEVEGSHEEPFPVEEDVTPDEEVAPEPEGDAFVEEEPSAVFEESPEPEITAEPEEGALPLEDEVTSGVEPEIETSTEETPVEEYAGPETEEEVIAEEAAPVEEEPHAEPEIEGSHEEPFPVEEEVTSEEEVTAEPEEEALPLEDEVTSGVEPELETSAEETPNEEYAGPETEEEVTAEEAAPVEEELQAEPEIEGSPEEPFSVEEDVTREEEVTPEEEITAEPEEGAVAPESEGDAFVEEEPSAVEETPLSPGPAGDVESILESSPYRDKVQEAGEAGKKGMAEIFTEPELEEAIQSIARASSVEHPYETYEDFKTGIEKQLSSEDAGTHYRLGIEYMEMELFKEASREFKIAMKARDLEYDCYKRLAQCSMSETNYEEGIIFYLKALKVFSGEEPDRLELLYDLSLAYEAAGHVVEAATLMRSINEADPDFKDVTSRVKKLSRKKTRIPINDSILEVELL